MTSYVSQIESISKELKRMNTEAKKLREKKKNTEAKLYEYMVKKNLLELGGIKLKKLEPKPKVKRLKKKEKDRMTVDAFRKIGVPDPEGLLKQIRQAERGEL